MDYPSHKGRLVLEPVLHVVLYLAVRPSRLRTDYFPTVDVHGVEVRRYRLDRRILLGCPRFQFSTWF